MVRSEVLQEGSTTATLQHAPQLSICVIAFN